MTSSSTSFTPRITSLLSEARCAECDQGFMLHIRMRNVGIRYIKPESIKPISWAFVEDKDVPLYPEEFYEVGICYDFKDIFQPTIPGL